MDKSHQVPDDSSRAQPIFQELKASFKTGATSSASFRKTALENLIRGMQELKGQFSEACEKDLGINDFMFGIFHYNTTMSQIRDLKSNFKSWMKPTSVPTPMVLGMSSSSYEYSPLGVVLVLSAWNYPIYTAIPQLAAAISAGNCVLLKPSEIASESSAVLKKLFDKYLDPKYFQCLEGKVEVAKAVTKLPFDMICFTGSTFTGRLVAIQAAKNITPCLLELGGKCPTIVDQTANIQSAVNRILLGRFANCGQTCVGVDHLYVHQSIYEQFKKLLLTKLREGYSHENCESKDFGKIISDARFDRLNQLLSEKHGGNIIFGGNTDKKKRYIAPTVVEDPSKSSLMMNQQIFGPILPLFSYSNLDEVINEINGRQKPLAIYFFSENKTNISQIKDQTQSGCFMINEAILQVANNHLPFGGVGGSGYGRYHGIAGFKNFSYERALVKSKSGDMYPMTCRFPPYTQKNKNMMTKLGKLGHITYSQIGTFFLIIFVLIALGLGLGLGIPAILNAANKNS